MENSTKETPQKLLGVDISIVVPVYNEEDCIQIFYNKLNETLMNMKESWEIIFIDDGSTDRTFEQIRSISSSNISGLRFSRNFGKESAILAGLKESTGKCAIVIDGDGQHPVEYIPQMIDLWKNEHRQIVTAVRKPSAVLSLNRLSQVLFYIIMKLLTNIDMMNSSDFKLLDRKVIDALIQLPERNRFFRGLTVWVGFNQCSINYHVAERISGKTKWRFIDLLKLSMIAVTGFTAAPLRWSCYIGVMGILFAVILFIQAIYSWITGIAVSGWTSLTIVIILFSSMQLFVLGIIGLYIALLSEESKGRFHFFIVDKV